MKKLSAKQRATQVWRARRGNNSNKKSRWRQKNSVKFKPFEVSLWDGTAERVALCLRPPKIPPQNINFAEDVEETLIFLKNIRDGLGKRRQKSRKMPIWLKERDHKIPTISGFFDYSKINTISISAALVLASCYDRAKRLTNRVPPAINYADWPSQVFQTLYDVGFFEFIGHSGEMGTSVLGEVYRRKSADHVQIMSAITGRNANGLEACSIEIERLLKFISPLKNDAGDLLPEINTAISEAMINVSRHAYPDEFVESSVYDTVGQWWMTARADQGLRRLTIVVYDQGATIPGTLPHRAWFQNTIENVMRAVIPAFIYDDTRRTHDHEYINYSMQKGKTQTGERERGLGLPQMRELIDLCRDGTLTVVSRAGLYRYSKGTGVSKRPLQTELEGTLVEWELFLPIGMANG